MEKSKNHYINVIIIITAIYGCLLNFFYASFTPQDNRLIWAFATVIIPTALLFFGKTYIFGSIVKFTNWILRKDGLVGDWDILIQFSDEDASGNVVENSRTGHLTIRTSIIGYTISGHALHDQRENRTMKGWRATDVELKRTKKLMMLHYTYETYESDESPDPDKIGVVVVTLKQNGNFEGIFTDLREDDPMETVRKGTVRLIKSDGATPFL